MASVVLKEEKICYKNGIQTQVKPIIRNHVAKLEFTQGKTEFSERGLPLRGLMSTYNKFFLIKLRAV